MRRIDWLALILIGLVSLQIISTRCLAFFSVRFMNDIADNSVESYSQFITEFRRRQLVSILLIIFLFCVSWFFASFYTGVILSHMPWLMIISTALIAHAAFDQLGWQLTWSQDALIDNMNRWYFRIVYSIGVVLLFVALLK